MIYAIWAYENQYGGLHGIEDYAIIEADQDIDIADLEADAAQMSREVIEDYTISEFYGSLEEDEDLDEEDIEDLAEDFINENIAYNIYKVIKDEGKTVDELENMFINYREDFIENYCEEI
jgi:hypothetical protein